MILEFQHKTDQIFQKENKIELHYLLELEVYIFNIFFPITCNINIKFLSS